MIHLTGPCSRGNADRPGRGWVIGASRSAVPCGSSARPGVGRAGVRRGERWCNSSAPWRSGSGARGAGRGKVSATTSTICTAFVVSDKGAGSEATVCKMTTTSEGPASTRTGGLPGAGGGVSPSCMTSSYHSVSSASRLLSAAQSLVRGRRRVASPIRANLLSDLFPLGYGVVGAGELGRTMRAASGVKGWSASHR